LHLELAVRAVKRPVRVNLQLGGRSGGDGFASRLVVTVAKGPGLRASREKFEIQESRDLSPMLPV